MHDLKCLLSRDKGFDLLAAVTFPHFLNLDTAFLLHVWDQEPLNVGHIYLP